MISENSKYIYQIYPPLILEEYLPTFILPKIRNRNIFNWCFHHCEPFSDFRILNMNISKILLVILLNV